MEVRPLDQLLSVLGGALKSSSLTPCMCQVAIIIIIITMARMKRREIISKSLAVFLYIHHRDRHVHSCTFPNKSLNVNHGSTGNHKWHFSVTGFQRDPLTDLISYMLSATLRELKRGSAWGGVSYRFHLLLLIFFFFPKWNLSTDSERSSAAKLRPSSWLITTHSSQEERSKARWYST